MDHSLAHAAQSFAPIPQEEINKLQAIARKTTIKKGNYFLLEGDLPTHFGFVIKGLFRYYYIDSKGNEFTKGFFAEKSFISAYDAMLENRPSYYSIEALEDSDIVLIDYVKWKEQLYPNHNCWKEFILQLVQKGYLKKVAREREFLVHDAETRYTNFLRQHPGLNQRVKQHLIASYLGITSVALSRIRRKMGLVNIG